MGKIDLSACDYPGEVSILFPFQGCPAYCPFCFNDGMLGKIVSAPIHDYIEKIAENIDFIDAIVIGGGEPTFQPDEVITLAAHARTRGLKVLLQTSLIYPKGLQKIIKSGAIDYIQQSINQIIGSGGKYQNAVKESLELTRLSNIFTETKVVYIPGVTKKEDIVNESYKLQYDEFTLQQFLNENTVDPKYKEISIPNRDILVRVANDIPGTVYINTRDNGKELIKNDENSVK